MISVSDRMESSADQGYLSTIPPVFLSTVLRTDQVLQFKKLFWIELVRVFPSRRFIGLEFSYLVVF